MKQGLNYALFGAVIAVSAGLIGAYGLPGFSGESDTTGLAAAQMLGHITLTHTDGYGEIISYRQTDNIIVDGGEACAVKSIFGRVLSTEGLITVPVDTGVTEGVRCDVHQDSGVFDVIAIGNATSAAPFVTAADFRLESEINQTESTGEVNTGNLERASSTSLTKTYEDGTSGIDAVISAQFTNTNGLSYTITESGLFNSTDVPTGGVGGTESATTRLFAHQGFDDITLDTGESLTVEWTITIGGTDTLSEAGEPLGP